MAWWGWLAAITGLIVIGVVIYDLAQRHHAILRNFPVLGHFRYLLEGIGPELRQYIVVDNNAEQPFSRDQRRWIYTGAKRVNTYFGFGTDNNLESTPGYLIIKPAAFPARAAIPGDKDWDAEHHIMSAKIIGGARRRPKAFRAASVVNISSMSYGALGAKAVESLNKGALLAGCWQGTGEGGISVHHQHGGDLVWQVGTSYFGCRDEHGRFDISRLRDRVNENPQIRMIEIKLSQGAKAGLGGLLPAAKVTAEIAALRGIPEGVDCWSPTRHSAFHDADSLLDFVELIAAETGLPVGIKSAVGQLDMFCDLATLMAVSGDGARGVDFINIDGGEGGTGAGPLVFGDHVALPFKMGFARVYREFAQTGTQHNIVFSGAGKLGLPENALLAFALGCDTINVGREAMFAIGCIQAQRCHSGRCPTGVTTNNAWLQRGLDPALKSVRFANYIVQLRKELIQLSQACGVSHPGNVTLDHIELLDGHYGGQDATDIFDYQPGWGLASDADRQQVATEWPTPR